MHEHFNVTETGYSHIKADKICQDFSTSYSDGERTFISACDGHGGAVYVRSHKGSKFASRAALNVMLDIGALSSRKYSTEQIENNLKLKILCEWNRLVEEDLSAHPLTKKELDGLNDSQIASLKKNPAKAYGSTLGAAMICGRKLVCVGIGDGGCFLIKNGKITPAFPEDEDEPVANVTYSLCGEDAFEHISAKIFDVRECDGVLLCTDGVLGPYQTVENFNSSFVRLAVRNVLCGKTGEIKNFVRELGKSKGIGDDVSLAMIVNDKVKAKYYQ